MGIARSFLYRPLSVLGVIVAIHTIVVGLGFLFVDNVRTTPLYLSLEKVAGVEIFGWVLVGLGLVVAYAYIHGKGKLVALASYLQTLHWLFIFCGYYLAGQSFLGLQNALFWAVLSGYVAFAFGNRSTWVDNSH